MNDNIHLKCVRAIQGITFVLQPWFSQIQGNSSHDDMYLLGFFALLRVFFGCDTYVITESIHPLEENTKYIRDDKFIHAQDNNTEAKIEKFPQIETKIDKKL